MINYERCRRAAWDQLRATLALVRGASGVELRDGLVNRAGGDAHSSRRAARRIIHDRGSAVVAVEGLPWRACVSTRTR